MTKLATGMHTNATETYKSIWYVHELEEGKVGWATPQSPEFYKGDHWINLNAAAMPHNMGTALIPIIRKGDIVYMVDLPEIEKAPKPYPIKFDPDMYLKLEFVTIPHDAFPTAFNEGYPCGKYD